MDMLTDVIGVLRTGRPVAARVGWRAPWAQRFERVPGASGFHVVVRGEAWLVPDDDPPVRLRQGDVVFLPDGRGHVLADAVSTPVTAQACAPGSRVAYEQPEAPTTVTLCGAYELGTVHPMLRGSSATVHRGGPDLLRTAGLLADELESPGPGSAALVPGLLDALLVYLLRAWFESSPDRRGWVAALRDRALAPALHAIHRSPGSPWTVASLAGETGMSRAAFAERFTHFMRQPPMAYLTWWRLVTAAKLLRDTDVPLSTVAREVGYGSQFAFATAFKREHGIPPGRFRRAMFER
ncbi:MAG: AraC family transcriptional regulator [Saccharothrix sp.]|nr:AraC family transcriptional regulator [Saccharothrix sp.]NUT95057.1 AraC family transcriptional regulator [Saccharothrix sp.]